MAIDLNIMLIDRVTDEARRHAKKYARRSYTYSYSHTLALPAGVRTEIDHNMTTLQFVYLEVVNANDDDPGTVYVSKNMSPDSWTVQHVFLCCDTSISQLSLMSTLGATVYLYLGGE